MEDPLYEFDQYGTQRLRVQPPSQDELARQQQEVMDWYKNQGYEAFLSEGWGGGPTVKNGMGLYNAGSGVLAYVPMGDQRFIPAPQHKDSFKEANEDWANLRKNPGHIIPLIAATVGLGSAALGGGAAGAEGGAAAGAGAGATEGGAAGGGWMAGTEAGGGGLAFSGGTEAGGALAGGSAAGGTVAGSGSGGGSGGGTMGEELLYDPSYYDAGNTGYYEYGGSGGVDPYGTGVDMYGNPTGEYSQSTFGGDVSNTGYGEGSGGGYSIEDLYKMGQKGYGYAQQAKGIYDKYKGLFGIAAGGVAGALGTPKQAGTTTTTEDLPDWLKGPAQLGVSGLANAYARNPTGQTPLLGAGSKYLTDVMSGQYLNNNPYLDQMYDRAAGKVSAGVNALFSKGGRYGSGAHQGVLGESLGNLATDIYAGNYARERSNQQAVGMQAPQLSNSILSSGFVPAQNLLTGIGAVRSRNISTPYYDSTLNNILSGAMGGKALFA